MYSAGIQKQKINLTENRQNETWTEGHGRWENLFVIVHCIFELISNFTGNIFDITEAISFAFPI